MEANKIKLSKIKDNSNKLWKSILVKLGFELELEKMPLMDGVTMIEADAFEPEMEVFIITEDEQRIPLPIGEYELQDGRILVVAIEGVIAEIKEKMVEEPVAEEMPVEAEQEVQPSQAQPKSIIESTSREMRFSKEDMDAKDAKIAELEAKIVELTKIDEQPSEIVEFSDEPKPIVHNPENSQETEMLKFGSKQETKLDRIYKIING